MHTAQFADFLSATVVTTVDTMTAPLDDVFFPSVVVCNINQVAVNSHLSLFTKPKLDIILTKKLRLSTPME